VLYGLIAPPTHLAALGADERARCGLPVRQPPPIQPWIRACELEAADLVLAPGAAARASLLAAGLSDATVVLAPPVFPARAAAPPRRGPMRLLFASDEPLLDGLRTLLETWDRASLPNAALLCQVDREVLGSRALLRHLVLHPEIEVSQPVPSRHLAAMIEAADCIVLPSLHAGFPAVALEAMARGRPVVVSDACGLADVLRDGEDGWVVPADDAGALAEALTQRNDRTTLARAGAAARATASRFGRARFRRALDAALDGARA
jgi:glycosyltransferase involved in cell wall biosynthesis